MLPHETFLTIGRLAEEVGVNVETIRFYQRKGLLQEPGRPIGAFVATGKPTLPRRRLGVGRAFASMPDRLLSL